MEVTLAKVAAVAVVLLSLPFFDWQIQRFLSGKRSIYGHFPEWKD